MAEVRWKDITDALEREIVSGKLLPGERLLSEDEIAIKYSVSRPTAHRAVRELQSRGFVTRQRRWGTVVAERSITKTKRIGLIIDFVDEAYGFPQPGLLKGIQTGLSDEYSLVLCKSQSDLRREADLLHKMGEESDGIVIMPTGATENTPLINQLIDRDFPVVLLDRVPEGILAPAALTDNYSVTRAAVETLIEQGHRSIGFLSFYKPYVSTVQDRFRGYKDALATQGIRPSENHIRFLSPDLEHSHDRRFCEAVQDVLFRMVNGADPITAVFCVQDMFAAEALSVFESFSKRVPEDLAIATFNDWPALMLRKPWAIHRIVPRVFEIGRVAGEALRNQLAGKPSEPTTLQVHADFIVADAGVNAPSEVKV
jgi:GntR family transcriptional regulator of arabinose operon